MKKRQSKFSAAANPIEAQAPRSRRRLWLARIIVMFAVPLLLLLVVEMVLRAIGFGYPTSFLVRKKTGEGVKLVQNSRFGWRFFGERMARTPQPLWISEQKDSKTIRIFVFGESAAFGDPQPRFSVSRCIEALLSGRYPHTRFEVINTAMTGINSHVIVPIASDCADVDADIWVVYMGNNEVVGPFGAGTVFGPQVPPLPLIRSSIALKATRVGQALDTLRQRLQESPPGKGEWGGMTMFLDQQVGADDQRMERVYRNFEKNLSTIIRSGERAGVKTVVSTVAVNLRDSAPFASKQGSAGEGSSKELRDLLEQGSAAHAAGQHQAAFDHFKTAIEKDPTIAELQFRAGTCALELNRPDAAAYFSAARDLDTLRFRCDSRLNEITRRVAADNRVALADAERAFASASGGGVPGHELFYEHVHLTFEGNYLLAETIVKEIEALLPASVREGAVPGKWPGLSDCANRLGYNEFTRHSALSDMLNRLSDAPFNQQSTYAVESQRLAARMEQASLSAERLAAALKQTETALEGAPKDAWLWLQAAALRLQNNDAALAADASERAAQLWPSNPEAWSQLGFARAQQQKFEAAVDAFRQAFAWEPQDVWALQNLAQALAKLDRREEAIEEYQRAVRIKPAFGTAWLGLGQLYESAGQTNRAEECFQKALRHRIRRGSELATLARFCQGRGWLAAAATNYADAVMLSPGDAALRIEAGQNLEKLGKRTEAAQYYADAVRLKPDLVTARFLHGLALGREGKAEAAVEEFRAAVRLMPELVEARINLGTALMNQGKREEAAAEFEEVLRRAPNNAVARQHLRALQSRN
ncbi:MAG TPA: tetratricopeptide repeat protein [Verrucomicrobiae bacterium]|nr:tetratricopeptide repeat protein [Verrucomicrobiae bacterium]